MPIAAQASLPCRVAEVCRTDLGLRAGDAVLVAVSAGADSTALACLLAEAAEHGLPLGLVLGHVDHGWRGRAEADADRGHVRALARRLGVPVRLAGPPPPDTPRTEDAARRFRYRALAGLARQTGCRTVATGHHAGDQAETFLMRLLRGSGLAGLSGIPRRRSLHPDLVVVRPLLEQEPDALRAWLEQRGVPWREDATNRDLSRDRAAIRARLQRSHARTLATLATRLGQRLERRVARIRAVAADDFVDHPFAGAVAMPRDPLRSLTGEDLSLALRLAGERLGADRDGPWFVRRHVARFEALLERDGRLDLPRGLFLHVAGKMAWLAWRKRPTLPLPPLQVRIVERGAFDLDAWRASANPHQAALDPDRLGERPVLRLLDAHDRFRPLGGGGETRVSAWLSKQGVPAFVRRGQLVVAGRAGVAWVVGRRPDAEHAVREGSRRVAVVGVAGEGGSRAATRAAPTG